MAERKAEEERLAMEKALRERRWQAAAHIQRFWQGYKVRKVNFKFWLLFNIDLLIYVSRVSKPKRKRREKKVARRKHKRTYILLFTYYFFFFSIHQK
jgi:hypothetical protein